MQEHKRERVKKRISITDEDEQIVTITRQFPIILRRPLIFGLLIVLVGISPWTIAYGLNTSWLGIANIWLLVSAVFLLIYWIRAWVGWHYSVYVDRHFVRFRYSQAKVCVQAGQAAKADYGRRASLFRQPQTGFDKKVLKV